MAPARDLLQHPRVVVAICWLALAAILLAVNAGLIAQIRFRDPDDTMRLVQVRDLLAGQGWFDLHQYRLSAPDSPVMHWSRLVDLPLALSIALFTPFFGQGTAEVITAVLVPLLTLGVVMAMTARLSLRLGGREYLPYVCLALGLSASLVWQLQPLRIDHHGWQIAAFMAALAAAFDVRPWRGGAMAGACLALGLTISLELLPQTALIGAVFFLRWWRDPGQRGWLGGMMAALPAGLALLALATRAPADLGGYCDIVGLSHLVFFAIAGCGTVLAATLRNRTRILATAVIALSGAIAAAAFLVLTPQCLAGPFGTLDPLVRSYWFESVYEGMPVWRQVEAKAMTTLLSLLIALAAGAAMWREASADMRARRLEYLVVLAGTLVAGLFVERSLAFAAAVAALPLGWLTWRLLIRFRQAGGVTGKALVAGALVVLLMPATPVALLAMVRPAHASTAPPGQVGRSSCDLAANVGKLDRLPRGTWFAPIDISPILLERTGHSVVATGHHRAQSAMRDVILAFTSPAAEAQAIVRAREGKYVIFCHDLAEPQIYAARAPDGLMSALLDGEAPDWLEPLDLGLPPSLVVYRVR